MRCTGPDWLCVRLDAGPCLTICPSCTSTDDRSEQRNVVWYHIDAPPLAAAASGSCSDDPRTCSQTVDYQLLTTRLREAQESRDDELPRRLLAGHPSYTPSSGSTHIYIDTWCYPGGRSAAGVQVDTHDAACSAPWRQNVACTSHLIVFGGCLSAGASSFDV